MLKEFRAFLLRGNIVDLAVAVIIGVAFGAVVASLVADIITPLIAAVVGSADFSKEAWTINGSKVTYGNFLNALITFLSVAAAVFFFVVKPMNVIAARRAAGAPEVAPAPTPEDVELLREIRDLLKGRV
jgi:large conductance mechanosensitive channel